MGKDFKLKKPGRQILDIITAEAARHGLGKPRLVQGTSAHHWAIVTCPDGSEMRFIVSQNASDRHAIHNVRAAARRRLAALATTE